MLLCAACLSLQRLTAAKACSSSFGCQGASTGLPTLLVFGGNGFVGTRICEEALKTGLAVVSISRSGAPKQNAAWTNEVEWVQVPYPLDCTA